MELEGPLHLGSRRKSVFSGGALHVHQPLFALSFVHVDFFLFVGRAKLPIECGRSQDRHNRERPLSSTAMFDDRGAVHDVVC
jgi:hypothetical protein